jgi:hypothetical protein
MPVVESKETHSSSDSASASKEPTITGSHYGDEKAVDIEEVTSPSQQEAPAAPASTNTPPRPTGIRLALIFVGYVWAINVYVCV